MAHRTCPRCNVALSLLAGALHEDVCGSCGGRFLPGDIASRVLEDDLGITPGFVRELCGMFGGERLNCPACEKAMNPVQLSSVPVDVCLTCGGLWCDPGELVRLTGGRRREVVVAGAGEPSAPAAAAAAAPGPTDVALSSMRSVSEVGDDASQTFVVYVADDTPLDRDRLVEAFTNSRRMTAVDARQRAAKSRGILARRLNRADAADLQNALTKSGVKSRAIDLREVPALAFHSVRPASFDDGKLFFFDQYNRQQFIPWTRVRAAGANRHVAHGSVKTPQVVPGGQSADPFFQPHTPFVPDKIESVRVDATRFDFLLDGPATRLAITDLNHVAQPRHERIPYMAALLRAAEASGDTMFSEGARQMIDTARLPKSRPTPAYEEEMLWLQLRLFHA